ncbi:uncharacterized protein LOC134817206 [Bolinopsis microptera]|uniref:uncharacterized protein LOC134817206 n=1 Tax=Bolinopsis microptera TaxID=2820187 RepID=UPI00307AB30E
MLITAVLLLVSVASADDCPLGHYLAYQSEVCTPCPQGTFSNIVNPVACRACPRDQYSSVEGAVQCVSCPKTAYTLSEGSKSQDDCVGPVMEICSKVEFGGDCYKFHDNSLKVHMAVNSLRVIRGEFKVYEDVELMGSSSILKEGFEARNTSDISAIGSFSALTNDVFCYMENGKTFRGNFAKAQSGDCINWNITSLAQFAKPNNLCRNPDPTGARNKPFCYVSETKTETCEDIPACVWEQECYFGLGQDYRGKVSETVGGSTCQNWSSNFPHVHGYDSDDYSWAGIGDHNYCRTPDKGGRPWCYTSSVFTRWDYCDIPICRRNCKVPICSGKEFPFYKIA